MLPTLGSLAAALLYLAAAGLQLRQISRREQRPDTLALWLGGVAVVLHGWLAWQAITVNNGLSFGFFTASSVIFLLVNVACMLGLLRRPLQNLLTFLFPLSAASLLIGAFAPTPRADLSAADPGVLGHILSSILAYAVLTLAAAQALLVAVLHQRLKHKHTRGIVQVLPPLQLMETMLFELIWVGMILLTASIASGMLFLEDMFAQHLVHKTVLTLAAWLLFALLLWGHHRLGWRSQTAVRFTLAGFAVLMLAYFGSKFVLELVLQRT